MTKKKPYYHNNWKEYKQAPDQFFIPLPFDEFMNWKVGGWEIPSSVACIIRENNYVTGKVTEHVYKKEGAARNKAKKIMMEAKSEFVVCGHETIHHLFPTIGDKQEELYDDPFT